MNDDILVYDGGALKALDDAGRVGGHLVLWGSPEQPDATAERDYFTPDTDFWAEFPTKTVVLYHHGLDGTLGPRKLGEGELKADAAGVWLEAQLKLRDDYERKVYDAVRKGKMGLSSGSVTHLVRREKQSNGTHKIISWPIFEASITPTPGEPRTAAMALKSLMDDPEPAESASFVETLNRAVSALDWAKSCPQLNTAKADAIRRLGESLKAWREGRPETARARALLADLRTLTRTP